MKTKDYEKPSVNVKKYFRIKDLMDRYGYSRGHIMNLIKAGVLPPPMNLKNVKQWPVAVIETFDQEQNQKYYKTLQSQGFPVPEEIA